jgi:hypothetical protein
VEEPKSTTYSFQLVGDPGDIQLQLGSEDRQKVHGWLTGSRAEPLTMKMHELRLSRGLIRLDEKEGSPVDGVKLQWRGQVVGLRQEMARQWALGLQDGRSGSYETVPSSAVVSIY